MEAGREFHFLEVMGTNVPISEWDDPALFQFNRERVSGIGKIRAKIGVGARTWVDRNAVVWLYYLLVFNK